MIKKSSYSEKCINFIKSLLFFLSYENFDNFEVRKTEPSSVHKLKKKIENEEFEKQIIQDLDTWDHKKHTIYKKAEDNSHPEMNTVKKAKKSKY